ncbi:MAG: hypothetical protein IJ461_09055 [Clostridia bacterium]|nr:hypothetical protein [Clostridia bacterium]
MKKRKQEPAYEVYEDYSQPSEYDDQDAFYPGEESYTAYYAEPEVVSTSQAVNLTCTLGALSSLFALFLYFNDERSRAVRRLSVQSIGLGAVYLLISLALLALGAVFGFIPIIGMVINLILWVAFVAITLVAAYLKIQMMKNAYRGLAYQLPVWGRWLRRFE